MGKFGQMSGRLDVNFPLGWQFLMQYLNVPYITTTAHGEALIIV
jgi:hypothetical protein